MAADQAIGVFDSGVGGLSVLSRIHQLLPLEKLIYVADSARAPYGKLSERKIRVRVLQVGRFLADQNVKAIVVACNTATSAAAEALRSQLTIPVIAMEPGVKPAVEMSRTKVIAVLATETTLRGARFASLVERFSRDCTIFPVPCPGWVELVESGQRHLPSALRHMEKDIQPAMEAKTDVYVLGCTHFPFLPVRQVVGPEPVLVDTGAAVARELRRRLENENLSTPSNIQTPPLIWINGDPARAEPIVRDLWNGSFTLERFLDTWPGETESSI